MPSLRSLLGLLTLAVLAPAGASASGYHPPFDRAVEEARWVAVLEVLSTHAPQDVLRGVDKGTPGEVYEVKVVRAFKGGIKKGQRLLVWDRYAGSTAGYFLSDKGTNLTFLVAPGSKRMTRPGHTEHWYGKGVRTLDKKVRLVLPIRNHTDGGPTKGRGKEMAGWIRLLELTKSGRRQLDRKTSWGLLQKVKNAAVLRYTLRHWRWPITDAEVARVEAIALARSDDAGVQAAAVDLLRKQGRAVSGKTLAALLAKGNRHARWSLLKLVDEANVDAVFDALWQWVERDDEAALQAAQRLAELRPGRVLEALKAREVWFWLEIPLLRMLKKTRADVGRPAYPKGSERLDEAKLADLGRLVRRGRTFGLWWAMTQRSKGWEPAAALLVPHLPKMKGPAREAAIGFMRTLGFEVKRKGKGATLGPRKAPPLALTLKPVPGQPSKIRLIETAVRPTFFCDEHSRRIEIRSARGSETSIDGTGIGFDVRPASKGCFRTRSGEVRNEVIDLKDLVKNVRKKGTYTVRVDLLHAHGGASHGLDGWTGFVRSPELTIAIDPAKAR